MKYMIAQPDELSNIELKRILDGYETLDFGGSFTTFKAAKNDIHENPPDIAFIRMGKAKLNAYELSGALRERNPFLKVVYISNHEEYAVEAFEFGVDGFLLVPFDREKIKRLLIRFTKKEGRKNIK